MNFITHLKNIINRSLFKIGYRISKVNNTEELVKIHKYKDYEEYKQTQIYFNKQKIDKVWADKDTLKIISSFLKFEYQILYVLPHNEIEEHKYFFYI